MPQTNIITIDLAKVKWWTMVLVLANVGLVLVYQLATSNQQEIVRLPSRRLPWKFALGIRSLERIPLSGEIEPGQSNESRLTEIRLTESRMNESRFNESRFNVSGSKEPTNMSKSTGCSQDDAPPGFAKMTLGPGQLIPCAVKDYCSLRVGPIPVVETNLTESIVVQNVSKDILLGGVYKPSNCQSNYSVAILVPYRNRQSQILPFLYHMHRFLVKQNLHYMIIFIEQADDAQFNRGMLLNIGYVQAKKLGNFNCLVFSDVDLLPTNERHRYDCRNSPKHMAAYIDKNHEEYMRTAKTWRYYRTKYFGGVSAMSPEEYELVNGFSNLFFGWGGEDDNLYKRLVAKKMKVHRYYKRNYILNQRIQQPELSTDLGLYHALYHPRHNDTNTNEGRYKLLRRTAQTMKKDGLTSLEPLHTLLSVNQQPLYTWIRVRLKPEVAFSGTTPKA